MRENFDRYGWLVALFTIVAFVCIMLFQPTMCTIGESCLREWVSALSGWIAAAAAFFTLNTIRSQISQADQHHQDLLEIQHRDLVLLAKSTHAKLRIIDMWATGLHHQVSEVENGPFKANYQQFLKTLGKLEAALSEPEIKRFEERIFVANANELDGIFLSIRQATSRLTTGLTHDREFVSAYELKGIANACMVYCDQYKEKAEQFLARWAID